MKLFDWVVKIQKNAEEYKNKSAKEFYSVIAENLKSFVQDTECVKIIITEDNQIYAVVEED